LALSHVRAWLVCVSRALCESVRLVSEKGGRRPRPGHAGSTVVIASARGHGHELRRVERGEWVRVCAVVAT
jgi:hypothetical protein